MTEKGMPEWSGYVLGTPEGSLGVNRAHSRSRLVPPQASCVRRCASATTLSGGNGCDVGIRLVPPMDVPYEEYFAYGDDKNLFLCFQRLYRCIISSPTFGQVTSS